MGMYMHAHTHTLIPSSWRPEAGGVLLCQTREENQGPGKSSSRWARSKQLAAPGPRGLQGGSGEGRRSPLCPEPPPPLPTLWELRAAGDTLIMWVECGGEAGEAEEDGESGPDKEDAILPTPQFSHPTPAPPWPPQELGKGRAGAWAQCSASAPAGNAGNFLPPPPACISNSLPEAPAPSRTPTISPRLEGLGLGMPPGRESLSLGSWMVPVILTKKSKLKRKRKYLVTLMQADPILSVLGAPWAEKSKAGGSVLRRTWAGGRRGN